MAKTLLSKNHICKSLSYPMTKDLKLKTSFLSGTIGIVSESESIVRNSPVQFHLSEKGLVSLKFDNMYLLFKFKASVQDIIVQKECSTFGEYYGKIYLNFFFFF